MQRVREAEVCEHGEKSCVRSVSGDGVRVELCGNIQKRSVGQVTECWFEVMMLMIQKYATERLAGQPSRSGGNDWPARDQSRGRQDEEHGG